MSKIISSATKISLLAVIAALIAGLFVGKISGDQFMIVVTAIVSFYFGQKKITEPVEPQA